MVLKHFSGTEDMRPNIITKDTPIACIDQKIVRVSGAVDEDQIHFGNLNDQIYIFLINHNTASVIKYEKGKRKRERTGGRKRRQR